MPFVGTFAGDSARGKGMFNAKIAYTAPTINTSGVITSMTTGATSGGNVSASGGSGVYSYSVYSGSLPYNLTLNTSTGYITGTLQAGGTFNVVFNVTDTVSGLSTQSGTVTITTTYSNVYLFEGTNPSSSSYSDLAKIDLNLATTTHNSLYSNTFVNTTTQLGTDSYGRIFCPVPSYGAMWIWSNGSSSSLVTPSDYIIKSNACLGPDGNMYIGCYSSSLGNINSLLKINSSLTQTAYASSNTSYISAICSDGGSKLYYISNGFYSFDTSTNSFGTVSSSAINAQQSTTAITYAADGNIYSPRIASVGTRVGQRYVLTLQKITTSGTFTNYTVHDPGSGYSDNTGGVCSTVVSGTPYVYVGGQANDSGSPIISSFNTSTNAVSVYNTLAGNYTTFSSVIAHTNGNIYGVGSTSSAYSIMKLSTSGTYSTANGTTLHYTSITSGP